MNRIFQSPECGYNAKWKSNLQTHIKTIHKGETFQCPECEYKAIWKGSLQTHIKAIHNGETF